MIRKWEKYNGHKNSIIMIAFPEYDNGVSYWSNNKKWLKELLKNKLITNLEYLDGIYTLKEIQNESKRKY